MDTNWFKSRLKEVAKTQKDLAEALNRDRTVITKMLAGKVRIQLADVPTIAKLLEVEQRTVLARSGLPPEEITPDGSEWRTTRRITVIGEVQAGVFREALEFPEPDRWDIHVPIESQYEGFPLIALKVRGPSMNAIYPEGTYVVAIPTVHLGEGWMPQNGKRYIVQRRNEQGGYEATIKEFIRDPDGTMWLWPRSFDKAFSTPWPLADYWNGDVENGDDADGLRIVGLVISSVRPE